MSEATSTRTELAGFAAVAWLIVPVAWGTHTVLEADGEWDSLSFLGTVGWIALVVAGISRS